MTFEELREHLIYCPDTGVFRWASDRVGGKGSLRRAQGSVTGSLNAAGYLTIRVNGKARYAHRLAVLWMTGGYPPIGRCVDHINGVPSDNRWVNLRVVDLAENNRNRGGHLRNEKKSSRFKWVVFDARCKRWCAEVRIQHKRVASGRFDSEVAAAFWADQQARTHQGPTARCNFPELDGYTVLGVR